MLHDPRRSMLPVNDNSHFVQMMERNLTIEQKRNANVCKEKCLRNALVEILLGSSNFNQYF